MTIKLDDRLTTAQRACLLRAARHELLRLKDEHDRLDRMAGDDASHAAAESADEEVQCLQAGVSWLWRDHLPSDST